MSQWDRKYRVLVVSKSGGAALDVSSLRCTFRIEKNMDEEPNYSQVTIYNLAPDTERAILTEGDSVIIEAGYYNDAYGLIFNGEIIQHIRGKEDSVTKHLTLVCQDGDHLLTSAFVAMTLAKGATHDDVVNNCLDGYSAGKLDLVNSGLPRAKILFGLCRDYLHQVAVSDDASFYVEDGLVNIAAAAFEADTGVDLRPDTGLIGTPQQTDFGIMGQCLLNPRMKLNSMIHIDSEWIVANQATVGNTITTLPTSGNYRLNKLVYEGDTRGDPWYVNFEGVNDELIEGGMQDAMDKSAADDSANLRVAMPGIIEEFNKEENTVKVQLAIMEKVTDPETGESTDTPIPVLEDVPVVFPRAGGYSLLMPIEEGDECLVVFGDMCIDSWWQSGGVQSQAETRRHDLSDGMAILGVWSQPNKIEEDNWPVKGARLMTDDAKTYVEVRKGGLVYVKGSLQVTGSIDVGGSSSFGKAPDENGEGPTHEFEGISFHLKDILQTDIDTPIFNINKKEYQDHTNGGLPMDKYY